MKPLPFFKGSHPGTNVVLSIGTQVHFIAPDATTAAKVADLLGQMLPVVEAWHYIEPEGDKPSTSEHVLVHGRTAYSHRVEIGSLSERRQFADREDFDKWSAEQKAAATQAAETKEETP